jgi:mono/diheme cytochrome c family protein
MRRLALLFGLTVLLAGCGGEQTVSPTAEKVVGTVAASTTPAAPAGNPAKGATLFNSQGCNGCHTFTPARSTAKIGPDLDKLPQEAQRANRGSLEQFTRESIENPSAYVEPGYKDGLMPNFGQTLSAKQISDLVAYLTKKS